MDSIAFTLLFALLFSVVVFHKKIKIYASKLGEKQRHNNATAAVVPDGADVSFPVITNFADIDECLKSSEDCDVTYKTKSSHTSASSIKKVEYALASNDEKNSPKYNPTVLQDIYPTDPA